MLIVILGEIILWDKMTPGAEHKVPQGVGQILGLC